MRLRPSFDALLTSLKATQECFRVLLTTADQSPRDSFITDRLHNAVDELLARVAEAIEVVEQSPIVVVSSLNLSRARMALTLCNDRVNQIHQLFADFKSSQIVIELQELGRQRGREWPAWVLSFDNDLGKCQLAMNDLQESLADCWDKFCRLTALVSNPGTPQSPESTDALEYARRLYDTTIDWYKNADLKAQILLTLDGAFLTFMTTSIFSKSGPDLKTIVERLNQDYKVKVFLSFMCVTLVASIVCALFCLWSRTLFRKARKLRRTVGPGGSYSPEVMWFFQMLTWLDERKFRQELAKVDSNFEIQARGFQILAIARNVWKKHLGVDLGFLFAGCTLILFLLAGFFYLRTF